MSKDDDDPDSPDVEALLERVDEKDERIATLESRLESLQSEVEAAKRAYASALAESDSVFDEDDLVESFDLDTLRTKFDDHADAQLADADPEPAVQSGGGQTADLSADEEAILADLDVDDRDEAVDLLEHRYERYDRAGWGKADEVADQLAALGVEVN